jgi:hypothetical protein
MLRCCVLMMVTFAFVARQHAGLPHAHTAIEQPADHGDRPHIHVASLGQHGPSHEGEHSHHHHDADGSHSHHGVPESETDRGQHDRDAVYLSDDPSLSLPTKCAPMLEKLSINCTIALNAEPTTTHRRASSGGLFFSGENNPDQPLWLTLRALRI